MNIRLTRALALALPVVVFNACGKNTPANSAKPCDACGADQVCFQDQCCTPGCDGRHCGDDGCGGTCGECRTGWSCSATGECVCARESPTAFCQSHQTNCGELTAKDVCGDDWTVTCDLCPAPQTCNAAEGRCVCVPELDDAFCTRVARCGTVTANDNCGQPRTVECGCPAEKTCDAMQKICLPCAAEADDAFCARLAPTGGRKCGLVSGTDNCGQPRTDVDCGACDPGYDCEQASQNCALCPRWSQEQFCQTHQAVCGTLTAPGNCGLTQTENCGSCPNASDTCDSNTCKPCVHQSPQAFCAGHGRQCGALTAEDNCHAAVTVTECGPCASGFVCDLAGSCVACVVETDAEFCMRNNVWCGSFTGTDSCGQARTVVDCATVSGAPGCPAGRSCRSDGRCDNGAYPPNDRCDTPDVLAFDSTGHAQVVGDTSTGRDDGQSGSPCSAGYGPDLIYRVHLAATMDMTVTETAAFPQSYAYVTTHVRTTCDVQSSQLGCDNHYATTPGTVTLEGLAPGDYFIWVDGNSGHSGPFTLDVQVHPPAPQPPNDACDSAIPILLVNGEATVVGTTRGATNDGTGSCLTMNGRDVVYSLDLAADSMVMALVSSTGTSAAYKPAVYITDDNCASPSEKACGGGGASAAQLSTGRYLVHVDGVSNTSGDFTLTVIAGPSPTNDNCTSPNAAQVLGFDPITRSVTVLGDTNLFVGDGDTSCNSSSGKDLVYAFEVPAPAAQNVVVEVGPLPNSKFAPNPEIRTACGDNGTSVKCVRSSTAAPTSMVAKHLAPGSYYLWLDGYNSTTNGPFSMTVSLRDPPPPPPNDVCAGTQSSVTLDATSNTSFTMHGSTVGAVSDSTGSCATMNGADVAYAFQVSGEVMLTATVTRDSATPQWQPALYLVSACPGSTPAPTQLGCASSSTAASATFTIRHLLAGTYFAIVDGLTEDDGEFTLTLNTQEAFIGDNCDSPKPLVFTPTAPGVMESTVASDTRLATNDGLLKCASYSRNDVVFAYEVPAGQIKNVKVDVTPATGFNFYPQVEIRTGCADKNTSVACVAKTSAVVATVAVKRQAAGTYYIWVDGYDLGVDGPFSMTVTLSDPPLPPPNDVCDGTRSSVTLDALTNTSFSVHGTTFGATNHSTGSCATMSGSDVAYAFTIAGDVMLTAAVARDSSTSGWQPALYVMSGCPGSTPAPTQLACGSSSTVASASAVVAALHAGTYYVIVDGLTDEDGEFTLTLDTQDPFTNDKCTSPKPLVFTPTPSGAMESTVMSDTRLGTNDGLVKCSSYSLKDVVFSYEVRAGQAKNVKVVVTPANGFNFEPQVDIRTTCADRNTSVACVAKTSSVAATVEAKYQPAGTYFIWVDGYDLGVDGPFTMTVTMTDPQPPSNDECLGVESLAIDPTLDSTVIVTGSTNDAWNDWMGSCRSGSPDPSGGDVNYTFTLATQKKVEVTVAPSAGSTLQPVAYLQYGSTCGSGSEVGCTANTSVAAASFFQNYAPAGTYYLVVDSYSPTAAGAFTLTVSTSASPTPPVNDQCANATPLIWNGTGWDPMVGDTTTAVDDERGYCSVGTTLLTGPDLVYTFTLSSPAKVTATVTRATGNTVYKPAVSIRSSCAPADEVVCARDSSGVSTVNVSLEVGTYYVFVDGVGSTTNGSAYGPFTLQLTQGTAIAADGCGNPGTITLDSTTGIGTVSGTLTGATNGGDGSCTSSTGADLVYQLTLPGERQVKVTLASTSSALYPDVYLRRGCANPASEVACNYQYSSTSPATFTINRLAGGTYYLWVDSYSTSFQGPFQLTVETFLPPQPAPANDTCAGVTPLGIDAVSAVQVHGDTTWAADDYAGTCATTSYPHNGGDVVYSFTLQSPRTVYATVASDPWNTATYYPALYLRTSCASGAAADQVACTTTTGYSAAAITQTLPTGTYYLVVDGQKGYVGRFILTVGLKGSANTNSTCSAAETLNFDLNGLAVAMGTTAGMGDETKGSCQSTTGGGDVVYAITLGGTKRLVIDALPASNSMNPAVYVQTACGTSTSELGCASKASFAGAQLVIPQLAAGTYYVIVDAYSASYDGPFTLAVRAFDPPAPPLWDTCANYNTISLPPSGASPYRLDDSTMGSADDYTGGCATSSYPFNGPDVVYAFTLLADAQFTAKVTAITSSYKPAVYVRRTCATIDQDACKYSSSAGSSATVTASLLAGTYYLIVDGVGGTVGDFHLDVSQDTAKYVAGDKCVNSVALTPLFQAAPNGGVTATVQGDSALAADDVYGSCGSSSYYGGDVVYRFDVSRDSYADISVGPNGSGSKFTAGFFVRRDCADTATEVTGSCIRASSTTGLTKSLRLYGLTAGTYFVWIDSYDSGTSYNGPFTATITVTPTPSAPANDSCRQPELLALPASQVAGTPVPGSTAFATDDLAGACETSTYPLNGPDVVYEFTATNDTQLTAKVAPTSTATTFKPAVYIRSTCTTSANDICKYGTTAGSSVTLTTSLKAGTYYLVVDGVSGTRGDFDLTLTQDTTKYVAGDKCSDFVALAPLFQAAPNGGVTATVQGDSALAADDVYGSCGYSYYYGGDVVYQFDVSRDSYADISVGPNGSGSKFTAGFFVRRACADAATEVAGSCIRASSTTGLTKSTRLYGLTPGSYYLWIDSYDSGTSYNGPFTATITVAPTPAAPPNDSCLQPESLALPASQAAGTPIAGSTGFATDDLSGACATSSYPLNGNDVVYSFTAASDTQITAKVNPASNAATFKPAVYIRSTCTTSANDICKYGTTAGSAVTLTTSLKAGTYYLVVDGVSGTRGDFELTLTQDITKYLAGDNCTNPTSLDASFVSDGSGGLSAPLSGSTASTVNATDNGYGTCGSGAYGDVVYSFNTTTDQTLSVVVTPSSSTGLRPSVYLRSACADASEVKQAFCQQQTVANTPVSYTLPRLPAGSWFLWVDSYSTYTGAFTGSVTLSPSQPAPANDVCSAAETLQFTGNAATKTADTTYATNDYVAMCSSTAASGPDLVYRFMLAQDSKVTATVARSSGNTTYAPTVLIRSNCGSDVATDQLFCGNASSGTAVATKLSLAAGTYYVIVDGSAGTYGPFDLTVTTDAPMFLPDTCSDAALIATTTGTQTFTGDTTPAANDTKSLLSALGGGSDVVYYFTLSSATTVSATLSYTGSQWAVVYIRKVCMTTNTNDELVTADSDSGPATTTPTLLQPGTYWVWVDAFTGEKGPYTLTVTFN